jgi:hypothetical protein
VHAQDPAYSGVTWNATRVHQLERPGGGGETPSFRTAVLEHGVNHMGRDQLAKLTPGGPVTLTGSLNCPVEHVAGDIRQNDGMPPYRGVLAVFGEEIQQPRCGAGLPVLAARGPYRLRPARRDIRRITLHHMAMMRNDVPSLDRDGPGSAR